jgi:hypothetical protein
MTICPAARPNNKTGRRVRDRNPPNPVCVELLIGRRQGIG